MTDLTQKLPVEVLAEILGHASVPDVLGSKRVNRVFRGVILSSPLIQHKIDLYAAGLEYNAAAGISLTESRTALQRYLSSLDLLRPAKEWTRGSIQILEDYHDPTIAGGIYAIVEESVRLFNPGSPSQRIPHKEWEIPIPSVQGYVRDYSFYPGADIIAFAALQEETDVQIVIYLRTLSSGGFHPLARCPTISYPQKGGDVDDISFISISSSRLVVSAPLEHGGCMVIWDWRSAQILFMLEDERNVCAEFIDDYRLLAGFGSSKKSLPCIVLMDTEEDSGEVPMQTSFHLPPHFHNYTSLDLSLERGVHKPSPREHLAPFLQDSTQRIATLSLRSSGYLIFAVGALSRLSKSRGGCEIGWDEWKTHTAIPAIRMPDFAQIWVSGCRLFCLTSIMDGKVQVYDFSVGGRAKYLSEQTKAKLGGVRYLVSTGTKVCLPWGVDDVNGGHDSIIFFHASSDSAEDDSDVGQGVLHIWTF